MSQNQNIPTLGIQVPTVDVSGSVVYKAGPWGGRYPVRKMTAIIIVTDPSGTTSNEGESFGDDNGKFRVKSGVITSAFSKITLQIHEDFTGQTTDLILYPGLIGPNQGPQDVGMISFPFEPEHPELAWINSRAIRDTQSVASGLSAILKSKDKRVAVDLLSEWRGTETIPVDQLVDDRFPKVTAVNGKVFKNPVSKGTQEERYQGRKEDAKFIRESLRSFKPIPLVTPAQKLLKMLYMQGFAKDFPQRIVKEMFLHKLVTGTPKGSTVESIAAVLDHFSLAKIFQVETPPFLRRLVTALQKAGRASFHSDTVFEEAAADMSAACTIIFLAGFMAKNNAEARIVFNYWHEFSRAGGVTERRPYVKISISAGK